MASKNDTPPEQEIIAPGDYELQRIPTPPGGVIKSAFFTAIQYGVQGRAVAAYKGAVREAVGAVEALRDLDNAVAERKQAQLILEHFDELVAKPDLDRLHARAAEAETDRLKAETELYKEELHSRQERAAAAAQHREAMGKSQEQPAHETPDAIDPNDLSREEYELAQHMKARAGQRASGPAGKKITKESILALRDMLIGEHKKARGGELTERDLSYIAELNAAAEEAIENLGLDDGNVIHL